MEDDGFANLRLCFFDSRTRGNAPWKIRDVCGVVVLRLFNHDRIAHYSLTSARLASGCCLEFRVPRRHWAFPGRPGLVGCLNWRWLPRVATRYQPSSGSRRSTSATFIAKG